MGEFVSAPGSGAGGSGSETADLLAAIREFDEDGYRPSRAFSDSDDVYDLRWELAVLYARRLRREGLRRLYELDRHPRAVPRRKWDWVPTVGNVLYEVTRQELALGEPVDTIGNERPGVFHSMPIESIDSALSAICGTDTIAE